MSIGPLSSSSNTDLLTSMLAELAKSSNELLCAKQDLAKIEKRLSFNLALVNTLLSRSIEDDSQN